MNAVPLISVIIPSYNMRATIRHCLRSVLDQDLEAKYEVIVVDSSSDGTDSVIRLEFPQALLFHLQGRTSAGRARNVGINKASGSFVAFTDADCIVARDWLRRMLWRHREGAYAAVGGSVANGTPWSLVGSAEHFFEFNEFLPQAPERLVAAIPTCNICYCRSALDGVRFDVGPEGANLQAEDLILNWGLVRSGLKLLFDPAIRVVHLNRTHLYAFLRHQYLLGQSSCWARKRTDLPGRIFADYPQLGLVLPIVRLARIGFRLRRFDRIETLRLLALSPLILMGASAWSAGFMREGFRR